MNSRHPVSDIVRHIFAAALFCAAGGVSAQTPHQQLDAAQSLAYSDRLDPTLPPQIEAVPALDEPRVPFRKFTVSPQHAALVDANEAARRLEQAQLKRKQGMRPLPGEQAQGAQAGALNHRYWRRQEKLRRAVELAQRRASETRRPQVAQR